jgi:hypothetical protein
MKAFILIIFILTKSLLFGQVLKTKSPKKSDTTIYAIPLIEDINPLIETPRPKFNFKFNELKLNDTLLIGSIIMDCGEFGGHNEYIYIYVQDSKIYAKLKREKLCDTKSVKNNPNAKFIDIVELPLNSQNTILNYINKFNNFVPDPNIVSNAPTDFWIKFKNENYDFHDQTGRWKEFLIIRNTLFEK